MNFSIGTALCVGFGGLLGASIRLLTSQICPNQQALIWLTLGINVTGCLAMGLLTRLAAACPGSRWQPFLGTGLLGGLTTFSGTWQDAYLLYQADRAIWAMTLLAATALLCVTATAFGARISGYRDSTALESKHAAE